MTFVYEPDGTNVAVTDVGRGGDPRAYFTHVTLGPDDEPSRHVSLPDGSDRLLSTDD
jgi:hypothetical protein